MVLEAGIADCFLEIETSVAACFEAAANFLEAPKSDAGTIRDPVVVVVAKVALVLDELKGRRTVVEMAYPVVSLKEVIKSKL